MRQRALRWAGLIGMAVLAGVPAWAASEKAKGMATPEIAEHRSLTVVGVEFPDAGERPYLILYAWAALAPKLGSIANQVKPHLLYGVWYKKPEAKAPSYLVGVEVASASTVPAGLAAHTIAGGRFIKAIHRGNVGRIGETYAAIMKWMKEKGADRREGATFEVYDTLQRLTDDYEMPVYEPIR